MFNPFGRCWPIILLVAGLTPMAEETGWAGSRGALYITSQPPEAQVYLDTDDEPRGTTPGLFTNLPVGTHRLRLKLPGHASVEEDVTVEADKVKDLNYSLSTQFGNLHIETSPSGAEIWLDNKPKGRTPLELTRLLATSHQIHIKLKGYQAWFKQIEIEANKTERLAVNLVPQPPPSETPQPSKEECGSRCHGLDAAGGQLRVESTPNGAHVWIDDELKGRTPLSLKLFPGDYTIRLNKPGYDEYQQRVQILPQEESSLQIELTYQPSDKDMVYIPAGEFIMGSEEGPPNEGPVHKVHLKAFYIDKYEVTNLQYRRFFFIDIHRQPSYPYDRSLGGDQQPVVGISWFDAYEYCKWAGKRLPTEAEWEKAARGTEGLIYPWGNQWQPNHANSARSEFGKPVEVGDYPKGVSPYGVFDMAGNVWEWCNDYYDENYYGTSPSQNPAGPKQGKLRVLRGGSWFDEPAILRTTTRRGENPNVRLSNIGFRCARDPAL
jgi:formylglycine-generating enzyme required for sulfatase activity